MGGLGGGGTAQSGSTPECEVNQDQADQGDTKNLLADGLRGVYQPEPQNKYILLLKVTVRRR